MASIFISYGDPRFKVSLDRILRQARRCGRFDKVIGYTPESLPSCIKSSPLFAFSQGGGYWCWKPYIISQALEQCVAGDIVYYADAGCSLVADSPEWDRFEQLLQTHSSIYFQYRRNFPYPGWSKYCKDSIIDQTTIKHWMKPALINYFRQFDSPDIFDFDSLWAGFVIYKNTGQRPMVLDQWLKIMILRPDLVLPPFGEELFHLPDSYCDHRCDQAILSPLVFYYQKIDNALVLPETSESKIGNPAVLASRWRQAALKPFPYLKYRLYEFLHGQ